MYVYISRAHAPTHPNTHTPTHTQGGKELRGSGQAVRVRPEIHLKPTSSNYTRLRGAQRHRAGAHAPSAASLACVCVFFPDAL